MPLDRDRFDETRSMVVDLGVLAKADAFVGSLWSNVGRLAAEPPPRTPAACRR